MEKIVAQGLLYDFYGELLTEHQRRVYEDVVFNDMSLSEIAEEQGISRQGVHDLVKRCDKILSGYEEKLKLVEKFNQTKKMVEEIKELAGQYKKDGRPIPDRQDRSNFEKLGSCKPEGEFSWHFESLADKLQNVFKNLRGKGRLTEAM